MTPRDEIDQRELARLRMKDTRQRTDRILLIAVLALGFLGYGVAKGEAIPLVIGAVLAVWFVVVFRQP